MVNFQTFNWDGHLFLRLFVRGYMGIGETIQFGLS